jgi:hypothetical protein
MQLPHLPPAFATTIGHVRKRAIAAVASKTVECKRHAIMSQHCTGHLSHCRHLKRQLFASRLEKKGSLPIKNLCHTNAGQQHPGIAERLFPGLSKQQYYFTPSLNRAKLAAPNLANSTKLE